MHIPFVRPQLIIIFVLHYFLLCDTPLPPRTSQPPTLIQTVEQVSFGTWYEFSVQQPEAPRLMCRVFVCAELKWDSNVIFCSVINVKVHIMTYYLTYEGKLELLAGLA